MAVKFKGNETLRVDDFDMLACYRDLGKTKSEKRNAVTQGIISNDGCTIPGMANLSFNVELPSTDDKNRTLVSNVGRAIVKNLAVKFKGNEILRVDDFDMFACYRDLGKTKSEKRNAVTQGIIYNDGCTKNYIN